MKKILLFNWKDIRHPQAGGAEVVTHELLKKLVLDGHSATLLTARYPGSTEKDSIDGIDIIRTGKNKLSHYFAAARYYKRHLKNNYDILIEEVNTIPYLIGLYKGKEDFFLFYHMLARKIWFYEMVQPFSTIGYLIEPIYTWLQSRFKAKLITVSKSSKNDIVRFGYNKNDIYIISEGIDNVPLKRLDDSLLKESEFTVLFHSSLRQMKRPIEVFKAFEIFIKEHPNAKLWISGGGDQSELQKFAIEKKFIYKVTFWGRTSQKQKLELMQKASVICSTSVKEGWGLIVTEANSMGTPAISYDVDGLRDSTSAGMGIVCKSNATSMANSLSYVHSIFTLDKTKYRKMCQQALESTKNINFDQSYKDFLNIIKIK
jgi:glycosyltransferase involved in cell wall biosynthesis